MLFHTVIREEAQTNKRNSYSVVLDGMQVRRELLYTRTSEDIHVRIICENHWELPIINKTGNVRITNTEARSRNKCCCGKAITVICFCVCVGAHARKGEWVCVWEGVGAGEQVCACARVAFLIQYVQYVTRRHMPVAASLSPPYFSTLSHKGHDFRRGGGGGRYRIWNAHFDFLYNFYLKHFSCWEEFSEILS